VILVSKLAPNATLGMPRMNITLPLAEWPRPTACRTNPRPIFSYPLVNLRFLKMGRQRRGLPGRRQSGRLWHRHDGCCRGLAGSNRDPARLAVAIMLTVYFISAGRAIASGAADLSSGTASPPPRLVLALLGVLPPPTCVNAAFAYLGINPRQKPAVEFEDPPAPRRRRPTVADTQVELHTDRNQRLAQVARRGPLATDSDGHRRG